LLPNGLLSHDREYAKSRPNQLTLWAPTFHFNNGHSKSRLFRTRVLSFHPLTKEKPRRSGAFLCSYERSLLLILLAGLVVLPALLSALTGFLRLLLAGLILLAALLTTLVALLALLATLVLVALVLIAHWNSLSAFDGSDDEEVCTWVAHYHEQSDFYFREMEHFAAPQRVERHSICRRKESL
jgi:hypothetical protein